MLISIEISDDEQRALEFYVERRKLGPLDDYIAMKVRKVVQSAKVYEFARVSREIATPYLKASPEVKRIIDTALNPQVLPIQYGKVIKVSTADAPPEPEVVEEKVEAPLLIYNPEPPKISPRLQLILDAPVPEPVEVVEIEPVFEPEPIILPIRKPSFLGRFLRFFRKN